MAHAAWIGQSRPLRRAAPPAFAPIFIALSFALPGRVHAAGPLPSGGQFVAGTGSINGNPTSLTINQTSSRGIIDWTSFSIGNGNHVSITNGTGATLNRVTGGDPSSILGTLSATGSVYLINP
ncbi:filamentous hemagglutinin family protein, partial [Trinickia symbiotica]